MHLCQVQLLTSTAFGLIERDDLEQLVVRLPFDVRSPIHEELEQECRLLPRLLHLAGVLFQLRDVLLLTPRLARLWVNLLPNQLE